jgi:hypothetical protein
MVFKLTNLPSLEIIKYLPSRNKNAKVYHRYRFQPEHLDK